MQDDLERAKLHPDVLKNLAKNKKLKMTEAYSEDNPPPYPVTSVNGQTGDVTGVLPLGEVTTKIPSNADLNDYVLPGVYAIGSSSTAATIANIPSQVAGTLRVFASAGNAITASSTWKYLIQEYITYTGVRFQRYGESGSGTAVTWGTWKRVCYIKENGSSGVWTYTIYEDGTVDLYLNATTQLTNYSTTSTGGLYSYVGTFPFSINSRYTAVAGCKVGTGISIMALTNALSGTQLSLVAQSNLTGTQSCTFHAHIHGTIA